MEKLKKIEGIPDHIRMNYFNQERHTLVGQEKISRTMYPGNRALEVRGTLQVFFVISERGHYEFLLTAELIQQDAHRWHPALGTDEGIKTFSEVYSLKTDDEAEATKAYLSLAERLGAKISEIFAEVSKTADFGPLSSTMWEVVSARIQQSG